MLRWRIPQKLLLMSESQYIIITGQIGAGKTSVCRELLKNEDFGFIPEFIEDEEDGTEMLRRSSEKEISVFEFQNYILDHYERKLQVTHDKRILMERAPEECALIFFACNDNDKEKLQKLLNRAQYIQNKYSIKVQSSGAAVIQIDTSNKTVEEVASVILNYLKTNQNSGIIFYLTASKQMCVQRVLQRERMGEKGFNEEYLEIVQKKYDEYLKPDIILE